MKKRGSFKDISLILILIMAALICNMAAVFAGNDKFILLAIDGVAAVLTIYCFISYFIKNKEKTDYIEILNDNKVTAANEVLNGFPLAMAVFDIDGAVLWFNDEFQRITGNNNLFFS